MSDLTRSYSVTRMSEIESRPAPSLFRTRSLLDVNDFVRSVDRFTPGRSFLVHNDSTSLVPWRFYRPSYLMDNYWWDKQYYFSPLYKGTQPYKNHYASHRVSFPCSWNYPHVYWARYKNYWYDSDDDYSPLYRRYYEPYFADSAYGQRFWNRYKSHLLNNDVY